MALAFFLPIHGKIVPVLIAMLFLNWLTEARFMNIPRIFREKVRLLSFSFAALYGLYLIGMLYSTNLGFGSFDLEVKLSLIVFPLVFATISEDSTDPRLSFFVFCSFLAGCFAGSLILSGFAFVEYIRLRNPAVFFYTGFSRFIHPSYLSMYLNLAISFIGYSLVRKDQHVKVNIRFLLVFLLLLFSFEVFLLSSKAGIFSLMLVLLLIILFYMTVHKNIWKGIIMIVVTGTMFYAAFRFLPITAARFKGAETVLSEQKGSDHDKIESNSERLVAWKAALEVIRKYPVFGVGTGDVKDELMSEYQRGHKLAAYSMQLNSHNQYFQTWIATGLAGLLVLVSMLVIPAWLALSRRDLLYFSFLAVFAFNLLVESMLEIQAGVIYYAFFNSLLFFRLSSGLFSKGSPNKK